MQRAGLGLMVRPETSRVSRCSNSGPVFLGSRGFSFRQGADREGAPTYPVGEAQGGPGTCHNAPARMARHDRHDSYQKTDGPAAWFGVRRYTESKRKPRACRGFRSSTEERLAS